MGIYGSIAIAQAMKMQEVMLRAMSGQISWIKASEILGKSPRTLRRIRARYQVIKDEAYFDGRRKRPSKRRVTAKEVQNILDLYREKYRGFNMSHFTQKLQKDHAVKWSYSSIKTLLQEAGLAEKSTRKGRHRLMRPRKECEGQMLQIDGSEHVWLENQPECTLIVIVDDASTKLLHAELFESESTWSIFKSLGSVFEVNGLPHSLYSDRASWAFYTPVANGKVDLKVKTQIGHLLDRLGVEGIPAYSPQAKGRVERMNRTLQDRLISELRLHGITEKQAANAFIKNTFIPEFNARFSKKTQSEESAFIKITTPELFNVMTLNEERKVNQDNTVSYHKLRLQIPKQPTRSTCARLSVTVKRHLDKTLSINKGPNLLARFTADGKPLLMLHKEALRPSVTETNQQNFKQHSRKEAIA